MRDVNSSCSHNLGAVCFEGERVFKANDLYNLEVLDRVGSGDAFAGGFIYGLLAKKDLQTALNYGAANSALTLTTLGDGSMATLSEIEKIAESGNLDLSR